MPLRMRQCKSLVITLTSFVAPDDLLDMCVVSTTALTDFVHLDSTFYQTH